MQCASHRATADVPMALFDPTSRFNVRCGCAWAGDVHTVLAWLLAIKAQRRTWGGGAPLVTSTSLMTRALPHTYTASVSETKAIGDLL
jgi:hypothetical protein